MRPTIIVHGGAGVLDAMRIPRCVSGCEAAARAGWEVLRQGGAALDAVEAAVRVLEDDGEFNAGYGAVLNHEGTVEVDAALMDGKLRAGAVAAVPWLRHPVTLARRVLDDGRHILLVADGALDFAREHGIGPELPAALVTSRARDRWERERQGRAAPSATGDGSDDGVGRDRPGDTVGAVAIDAAGGVAAASSTGGISYKHPGRVGDSPLVGSGLYALDGAGAATATGHGESILRVVLCKHAVDELRRGADAMAAARSSIDELAARVRAGVNVFGGGTAGIIVVDAAGRIGHHRDSEVMPWAAVVGGEATSGA